MATNPQRNEGGRIARRSVAEYLDRQKAAAQKTGNHGLAQFCDRMRRWLRDSARRAARPGGLGRK